MRKGTVVGIVIGAVLVAGVGTAVAVSAAGTPDTTTAAVSSTTATPAPPQTAAPQTPTPEAAATQSPDTTASEASVSPGVYEDYSDEALAAAQGTRVLFFHAPWCPQCRALEEDILAQGVPAGVTILKVDYDSRQDLRQRYGVTIQTTVVSLDDGGDATAVFTPYDAPTLASISAGLGLPG